MVKITSFPLQETSVPRAPGLYVVSTRNGQLYATKWPRKRGPSKSPGLNYQRQTFAIAASWAADAEPANYEMATIMAEDTTMIPRDFLTAAAYGKILTIFLPDGTQMERYWDVAANAQLTLDQVTTEVGSLIWRSPEGWVQIPPGDDGQVLTFLNNVPLWQTPGGNVTDADRMPFNGLLYPSTSTTVTNSTTSGTFQYLEKDAKYDGVAFFVRNDAPSTLLAPCTYLSQFDVNPTLAALGPAVTGHLKGLRKLPFSSRWTVPSSDIYFIGVTTRLATWNTLVAPSNVPSWSITSIYPPPTSFSSWSQSTTLAAPKCWVY